MEEPQLDLDRALEVAVSAVREAGKIQKDHFGKKFEIGFKSRIDVVTDVDIKCERQIVQSIRSHYPDHGFLAEEETDQTHHSRYKWIIDPLDGTVNFAHGFPLFSSTVALEADGQVKFGVVFDPLREELFVGKRNGGAFLNGEPIRVSRIENLEISLLATGFSYKIREIRNNNLDLFGHFAFRAQSIRRAGSATLDLCYVAMGRFDGFWEMNLFPWDMAAGYLIVEEAGGEVSLTDGSPFSLYQNEIVASNRLIHREMIEVFKLGECRSGNAERTP